MSIPPGLRSISSMAELSGWRGVDKAAKVRAGPAPRRPARQGRFMPAGKCQILVTPDDIPDGLRLCELRLEVCGSLLTRGFSRGAGRMAFRVCSLAFRNVAVQGVPERAGGGSRSCAGRTGGSPPDRQLAVAWQSEGCWRRGVSRSDPVLRQRLRSFRYCVMSEPVSE
jgi:hypothetical protein